MTLEGKLQVKPGQTIALLNNPDPVDVALAVANPAEADAVLLFTADRAQLDAHIGILRAAAKRSALAWLAYPKAKQLGTDLDRDVIRGLTAAYDLDTVRQISLDETWSALRLKYVGI